MSRPDLSPDHPAAQGAGEVHLGGGRHAWLVPADGGDPGALLARLRLGSHRVIVVSGGADELDDNSRRRARAVLGPAIALASAVAHASIVDDGISDGAAATVGDALAPRSARHTILLGVTPRDKVSLPDEPAKRPALEPHHSHFILAGTAETGGETSLLLDVAGRLAHSRPVVMVLAGSGGAARAELLGAVRRDWPVFVVGGTGELARQIIRHRRAGAGGRVPRVTHAARRFAHRRAADAELEEISRGDIRVVTGSDSVQFGHELAWELQEEPVLKDAWRTFATYDRTANRVGGTFQRFQSLILVLGVMATLLALIQYELGGPRGRGALHWIVVIVPILISALIAWSSRRADGRRWITLRAAAEAVKAEIYRYRTRTEVYGPGEQAEHRTDDQPGAPATGHADGGPGQTDARASSAMQMKLLQAHLAEIDATLIRTEASMGPLTPYAGPLPPRSPGAGRCDDGISPLDAEGYLRIRIEDQISYYHRRVRHLHRLRTGFELIAIAASGAGAIIAAFGADPWVGLTSGISGAALAYLGYRQADNSIVAYNRAATKLAGLAHHWHAFSQRERSDPATLSWLVSETEEVLAHERAGWVHQMSESLQQLKTSQEAAVDKIRRDMEPPSPDTGEAG